MPWDVGHQDGSQMRFARQQVAMSNGIERFVFDQEFSNDNSSEQIGRKAMHPQSGTASHNVGHGEHHEIGEKDNFLQVLRIGLSTPRKVERQKHDKAKDGHFDNAPQGQAVESNENERIVPDPVDDFFVGQIKAHPNPAEVPIDGQGWGDEFRQAVPSRRNEERRSLLIVVKATEEDEEDAIQRDEEHDEGGKAHVRFLLGTLRDVTGQKAEPPVSEVAARTQDRSFLCCLLWMRSSYGPSSMSSSSLMIFFYDRPKQRHDDRFDGGQEESFSKRHELVHPFRSSQYFRGGGSCDEGSGCGCPYDGSEAARQWQWQRWIVPVHIPLSYFKAGDDHACRNFRSLPSAGAHMVGSTSCRVVRFFRESRFLCPSGVGLSVSRADWNEHTKPEPIRPSDPTEDHQPKVTPLRVLDRCLLYCTRSQ